MSIHHSGGCENAELLFRTITSVSQLSIYGAVADWYEDLAQRIAEERSNLWQRTNVKPWWHWQKLLSRRTHFSPKKKHRKLVAKTQKIDLQSFQTIFV